MEPRVGFKQMWYICSTSIGLSIPSQSLGLCIFFLQKWPRKKNGIHWVGYGQNCLSWKRRYREWYQVTFVLRLCTPIFDQLPCCARLTDMKLENKSKPIPTVLDLCSTTSAHGFDGNSTTQLVAQSKNVLQLRRMN